MKKNHTPGWLVRCTNSGSLAMRAFVERQIPFFPIGWIEKIQRHRLRSTIHHAYNTVPFYRKTMDDLGLKPRDFQNVTDLQQLPLLDGMMIRTRLNEFVSSKYQDEHSRMSMYSSGTQSFVRRVTYWDHRSIIRKLAHNERDRAVLNSIVGRGWGQKQLFIYPPTSQEPGADRKLQEFWKTNTILRQSLADRQTITMDLTFEDIIDRINEIKPQVVFTYGSYIDQFFRYLSDRKPNIDLPRVWAYGADMLPADRREAIENEFGCIVYSTYQSVETGRLGFQCERRQGFHLNVDLCSVHVIDEEGKIVAPGRTGSIVVSNLHNRATVLLNYKLDDIGSLAPEACLCGRSLPVLERLEGRSSDIIRLSGNRTMSVMALEGICREELKPTIQVQIVQTAPDQLTWRIVPFSNADTETIKSRLITKTRSIWGEGEDLNVAVEVVEHIPRTSQGKFRKLLSNLSS